MPIPSFVTVVQLLFAVIAVYGLQIVKAIPADPLEQSKVKVCAGQSAAFVRRN